jgi:exonuclease III
MKISASDLCLKRIVNVVATWNVNSILARLPSVVRWLDKVGPDVLCMQETKCTDDKFPAVFRARLPVHYLWSTVVQRVVLLVVSEMANVAIPMMTTGAVASAYYDRQRH